VVQSVAVVVPLLYAAFNGYSHGVKTKLSFEFLLCFGSNTAGQASALSEAASIVHQCFLAGWVKAHMATSATTQLALLTWLRPGQPQQHPPPPHTHQYAGEGSATHQPGSFYCATQACLFLIFHFCIRSCVSLAVSKPCCWCVMPRGHEVLVVVTESALDFVKQAAARHSSNTTAEGLEYLTVNIAFREFTPPKPLKIGEVPKPSRFASKCNVGVSSS